MVAGTHGPLALDSPENARSCLRERLERGLPMVHHSAHDRALEWREIGFRNSLFRLASIVRHGLVLSYQERNGSLVPLAERCFSSQ